MLQASMEKFDVKSLPLTPMGVNILYVICAYNIRVVSNDSIHVHELFAKILWGGGK